MGTKIFQVDSVKLKLLKSNPPQLQVISNGTVSTPGWDFPELKLQKEKPKDGIYQFDFLAKPPTDLIPQILMPITAAYIFKEIPGDFKGVRINASSNFIEEKKANQEKEELVDSDYTPKLEVLMGFQITSDKLMIRVHSGGCTTKDNFKINVIKGFTGIPPYIVEIYRVVPDFCQMWIPDGVELEFDLNELGIEPNASFTLQNNFGRIRS